MIIPYYTNWSKAAYDEMKSYPSFAYYIYNKKLWYDQYLKILLKDYDNKKILKERNE